MGKNSPLDFCSPGDMKKEANGGFSASRTSIDLVVKQVLDVIDQQ